MQGNQSDLVLGALTELVAIDDVQTLVDRVCDRVVALGPYRLALLSLYFGPDVYIGLCGGDEEMRRRFLASAISSDPERRAAKRQLIWERYRIGGTNACFIPEGSEVPLSSAFLPSEARTEGEWRPDDRLMLFVRGAGGEPLGVLSLDLPSDWRRPDPAHPGPLAMIDRFMTLMGVVIQNQHLAAKLRESEGRYAAVVEQSHEGVFIAHEGTLRFANRRFGEMAGTPVAELEGRPVCEVFPQEELPREGEERESRLHRPDGSVLDVLLKAGPIGYWGAKAILTSVSDVTDQKRLMSQLLRAQKMESVGSLATGIAHDFNNLLAGIVGYASLLDGRLLAGDPLRHYVQSIEKAADRAASVTRQLLGIVRDEKVRVAPIRINELLVEVARLLRDTLASGIDVETTCELDLPAVLGDEAQIHQVLLNVCLNSRDAMPGGGRLTLLATKAHAPAPLPLDAPYVCIHVRDTGCGMDRATLQKVFDPFFTTKEMGKGTGLGLYMAYRIVERHGGTIDIRSKPGEGTTVEIFLPAARARAGDEAASQPPAAVEPGMVLLVDDEELIRSVGAEMLAALGWAVLTAAGGAEALAIVEERGEEISCVLLDLAMPLMDGWETARRIQAVAPALPIVVSSGHEPDARSSARALEGLFYLKKPYRIADLRLAVEEATRSRVV
ncbi:MAG: hybrid sensor histidine kinase/response regulator [Planctomycetaceae bacterium]